MAEKCAWCELDLNTADRQSIRFSNRQPPWSARSAAAAAMAAAAAAFSAAISAGVWREEPEITLWFHRRCWREFVALLRGGP